MRRAHHPTSTERALTLALVLVASGYAPGALPLRDLVLPRPDAAPAASRHDAARSGETRYATRESERQPDRVAPHAEAGLFDHSSATALERPAATDAPLAAAHHRSVFLAPPSERGPPTLG